MEDFKKVDAQKIAQTELKNLDLSQVDSYPLFSNCDETSTKALQKDCFEKELHKWLKQNLDTLPIVLNTKDTVNFYLSVDKEGILKQDSIQANEQLKSTLLSVFKNTPKLSPAHKRGVPVKVSFKTPIILNVK